MLMVESQTVHDLKINLSHDPPRTDSDFLGHLMHSSTRAAETFTVATLKVLVVIRKSLVLSFVNIYVVYEAETVGLSNESC